MWAGLAETIRQRYPNAEADREVDAAIAMESTKSVQNSCPFRKSYPDILMVQSGQDRNGDNDAGPLHCSMQGRIFL
jgi:hypothetical protein